MNDAGAALLKNTLNKAVDNPMDIPQDVPFTNRADPAKAAWSGVGLSRVHESAALHVLGQATYTDDIAEVQGTLHAALGLSARAHARITAIDLDPVRVSAGVVAVLTVQD